MPDYRESVHMAQLKPLPDDVYRLRAAPAGNQHETNRLFMARGDDPGQSFFNPDYMRRIMKGTVVRDTRATRA